MHVPAPLSLNPDPTRRRRLQTPRIEPARPIPVEPQRQPTELPRVWTPAAGADAVEGEVRWAPVQSLWYSAHGLIALIGGALTISPSAIAIFLVSTALSLCLGHSLGTHRRLVHRSYECPRWLEYLLVYLGVLVGMAGPFGMVRAHDLRDWAQRQTACHPYLRHGSGFWRDAWWQLHCELRLRRPPEFVFEREFAEDRVYAFMERTWILQQLPWAVLFYALGGLPWVIWGICARIAVSLTGHWLVGHFAHNTGEMDHEVRGAAVQGHNVRWAGYLSMGESWHNNHHAFPRSARLGLYEGQTDPGWWVLQRLHALGLVRNFVLPHNLPEHERLIALTPRARADARPGPARQRA